MTRAEPTHTWPSSTKARVAIITELFAGGMGRRQAADALGININQLAGVCFRNDLRPTKAPNTPWARLGTSAARLAAIQAMDAEGLRLDVIAERLGVTRTAINNVVRRGTARLVNSGPAPRPAPVFAVHPLPGPEVWAPRGPALHMDQLSEHTCRWPIEVDGVHQGYCGAHIDARSYCAHHYAVAYRPSSGRVSRFEETVAKRKPMASATAMRLTGVAARRVEVTDAG